MSKVIEYTRDIFGDEDEYRCCYRGYLGNKYASSSSPTNASSSSTRRASHPTSTR